MKRNRVESEKTDGPGAALESTHENSIMISKEGSRMMSLKFSRRWSIAVKALAVGLASLLVGALAMGQPKGSPPSIVKIEFPTEVFGSAQGKVHFRDSDGDLVKARFNSVEGLPPFVITPNVGGITEGSFDFEVKCGLLPTRVLLKLALFDQAGNKSVPAIFTFDCGKVPADFTTNYDQEQETVRPIKVKVALNFFVLEDEEYELAEEANFTEPTAMLGEPQEAVRRAVQEVVVPHLIGIYDQCGLGFELGVVRVVRPRNVALKGGITLESIFTEDHVTGLKRLEEAIPILNEPLKREGREIGKDTRNVFLLGIRPKIPAGGWAQLPGRVSVVRWHSIWVDPSSNEIFKPKVVIKAMAHELGHNFGLPHSSQNLMDYTLVLGKLVVTLTPEQCQRVEKNLSLPPF